MLASTYIDTLIVGLGNPGEKYAGTRHNVGWMVLDSLREKGQWSVWDWAENSCITSGQLFGRHIALLKPLTFMNSSGEAVASANLTLKCHVSRIVVIHDEMDIPFGDVRTKFGGSSAGHKGVLSVAKSLATPDFHRVRIGIGRPSFGVQVIDHVLSAFSPDELEAVPGVVLAGEQLLEEVIMKFTDT